MKKFGLIFVAILIVAGVFGYKMVTADKSVSIKTQVKNFGEKKTNKVPDDYTKEEALENGDILQGQIKAKERKRINEFKKNVEEGKPDLLRFIRFNTDDKPGEITEFQFNGEIIYYSQEARDFDGQKEVVSDYCQKIEKLKKPWKGTFLTHCLNPKGVYEF
ncbi:MAG: hypothetical protein ABGX20_15140 [Bacillus sp. (in: firmicutes)]